MDVIVENVSLLRGEAGFADLVSQIAFVGFDAGAGGGDYVFFDHDGAHVVGTESKGSLTEF